jgi:5-methyltetrahydropteroyltriglutamate--homocysteine methyltransferase
VGGNTLKRLRRNIPKEGGSLMVRSCDVGSFPFVDDSKFVEGANRFSLHSADESTKFFEKKVLEGLVDKIGAGIDVPNYPQFRDMNEMFLSMIDGVERINGGYIQTNIPSVKANRSGIPEVMVIEKSSHIIQEKKGAAFEIRICVTGPYTLSSFFPYKREDIFIKLGNVISQIVENSIFNNKHGRVSLVSVDEPVFGLQDDALIDFGSEGRENLRRAWESIFHKIKSKNAQTIIHLHSTSNPLFWEIPSLDVIESHVDDPLIKMKKTGELLESRDKFLKASVAVNDFDALIKKGIVTGSPEKLTESDLNEKIAEAWTDIKHGRINPETFLESVDLMKSRLVKVVDGFGAERVLYAGPECGLKGYPTYKTALECLRRVSSAVESFEK